MKKAMRLPCSICGDAPLERRLLVREGVGRSGTSAVYCEVCGDRWLEARGAEVRRARQFLKLGTGSIRRG